MYSSASQWRDFFTRSGSHSTKGTRSGRTDFLPVKPEAVDWTEWSEPKSNPVEDKRQAAARAVLLERQKVQLRRTLWKMAARIPVVHPPGREIPRTASEVVAEMRALRRQKGVIK